MARIHYSTAILLLLPAHEFISTLIELNNQPSTFLLEVVNGVSEVAFVQLTLYCMELMDFDCSFTFNVLESGENGNRI